MTIIEKIGAARNTFFRINGFMPNTIKMSMADYRATLELGDPNINVGMRIVKRAGEMECGFDDVLQNKQTMTFPEGREYESDKQQESRQRRLYCACRQTEGNNSVGKCFGSEESCQSPAEKREEI